MNVYDNINQIINCVAEYLRNLAFDEKRIQRSFYGETFAALALSKFEDNISKAAAIRYLELYRDKDKSDPEFHWEFNNYALQHMDEYIVEQYLGKHYDIDRFKYTDCTNWVLLRNLCQLRNGKEKSICKSEVDSKLMQMTTEYGLIKDNPDVESFQYHIFSAILLYEFYQEVPDQKYEASFLKAIEFIEKFILPNGCGIYIGRGQEQIFGYGALLYGLSVAYALTKENKHLYYLSCVSEYVTQFLYADNRNVPLPLTLNHCEKDSELWLSVDDNRHPGWYSYNNYCDYIAFFEYYALQAKEVLDKEGINKDFAINKQEFGTGMYANTDFAIYRCPQYVAVVSRGGGYWTNNQQYPLVFVNDKIIIPCCGGEQYGSSLYGPESLPLPYAKLKGLRTNDKSLLKGALKRLLGKHTGKVFLTENTSSSLNAQDGSVKLQFGNKWLKCVRTITFEDNKIVVNDSIKWKTGAVKELVFINLPIFNNAKKIAENCIQLSPTVSLQSSHKLDESDTSKACAMGALKVFRAQCGEEYLSRTSIETRLEINVR